MAERSWGFGDGEEVGNAKIGSVGVINGGRDRQGLYTASSVQNYPLGYRLVFEDGRVFRYAHFNGTVSQGKLAAIDTTNQIIVTSAKAGCNAAGTNTYHAAGVTTVRLKHSNIDNSNLTSGDLSGGILHVTDDESEGYSYKIKHSTVVTATSVLQLELYDATADIICSDSSVAITGNRFKNCAIYNAGTDDVIAGVTMGSMTADTYGWVQTWGEGTVLMDGTPVAGYIAAGSDGVDGAVQLMGGGINNTQTTIQELYKEPLVGYFISAVANTQYVPLMIQIAP